jgi:UDP-glucose 4-epimerase
MKILFTGASSFTGYWFVKELVKQGHHIIAIFRQTRDSYKDTRKKRVDDLLNYCEPVFECEFGSQKFLELIESSTWDLFCHHAADVTNYKSPLFSIPQALASNTHNLPTVLEKLQSKQCQRVILTGSVFEQNEGKGNEDLRAFSPYGLSKSFTAQVFQYYTQILKMPLGKFVIPNPFGPYEDPRFTTYLIQNWMQSKKAAVNTPDYIRDNIHVSLLALEYCRFATANEYTLYEKVSPSGYNESQGKFTERFSREMKPRLQLPCEFELAKQTNFTEPLERTNLNSCSIKSSNWDESHSWDQLADYYRNAYV